MFCYRFLLHDNTHHLRKDVRFNCFVPRKNPNFLLLSLLLIFRVALRANENNNTHQTNKRSATEQKIETTTTNIDTMSASELAPFVAAVIEDGIVAEMQRKNEALNHKIEELESNIQDRDNARLLVQITGRGGNRIYGQESLKKGRPIGGSAWLLNCVNCMCPFDKEEICRPEEKKGSNNIKI